ncbi:uncharacterized mitochondrial protein AtMg00860-like [Juglans microcarpa x Juglans regia]|uniref:uncharacterized mitochondrial protein AtMg00860-like n=1 Tax=Juglans microcarpa x Juglans regia TaxID=2249226 RepID=UPI001B7E921F|nr:uncharacterized mitochondrial protein AtMg00860-like [Juglans microcarpa x Juglans regia]
MNEVFKSHLRKFILVFFDDILIYSKSEIDHLRHVQVALETLREHKLYAKLSKCKFWCREIAYLGHLISAQGVRTDIEKLQAMKDWPLPGSIKALRGFLELTGYYRRFIKDYGGIAGPLTRMLRKGSFQWSEEAKKAFHDLKESRLLPLVLALPDFTAPFTIKCDALGTTIGAVLM